MMDAMISTPTDRDGERLRRGRYAREFGIVLTPLLCYIHVSTGSHPSNNAAPVDLQSRRVGRVEGRERNRRNQEQGRVFYLLSSGIRGDGTRLGSLGMYGGSVVTECWGGVDRRVSISG
jgi:hypothetical protein